MSQATTTTQRTQPLTNAERQKRFYHKHREVLAKERVLDRIRKGSVPQKTKWAYYKITGEEINRIRRDNGHAPLDLSRPRLRTRSAIKSQDGRVSLMMVMNAFDLQTGEAKQSKDDVKSAGKRFVFKTGVLYKKRFTEIVDWVKADHNDVVAKLKKVETVEKAVKAGLKKAGRTEASVKDYFTTLHTLCKDGFFPTYCEAMGAEIIKQYHQKMSQYKTDRTIEDIGKTKEVGEVAQEDIEAGLQVATERFPNTQNHLIISLYNDYALRDDFGDVLLGNFTKDAPPRKGNYYDYVNNVFYLRTYKTEAQYGAKVYKLSERTHKIVKSLVSQSKGNRKYLVGKGLYALETYSEGKISSQVQSAFARAGVRGVSINAIRHARVASVWGNPQATTEQKRELADDMNHTVAVAQLVYQRQVGDDDV